MSDIQLTGNLKLNSGGDTPLADVSAYVAELRLTLAREQVFIPTTLARSQYVAAGDARDSLTIAFYDGVDASGIWARLWRAIRTPKAEIQFSGSWDPGPAGTANNPLVEGVAVVTDLDVGTRVGELRFQTLILPIKSYEVTGGPA